MGLMKAIFGNYSSRELKRIDPIVNKIEALSDAYKAMGSARYGARLSGIRSAAASGSGTVVLTLSAPNADLPALLDIPIVKAGTESNPVPIGTGPYRFVSDENGTRLAANANWWTGAALPADSISLTAAQDRDAILYQFNSHDIQLITADLAGTDPISATGNVSYLDADTTVLQYVGFNLNGIFSDPALRNALSLGIDRDALISACLSGHGKAAQFPISPACSLYPADLEAGYSYDSFQQAMAAAGWNTGKRTHTVRLLVNEENTFKTAAAKYLASALSAFDLKLEVESLPFEEYQAALQSGRFDLYYAEVRLTADWNSSALIGTAGAMNYGGYSDAATDQLLTAFASAADRPAAARALCRQLQAQAPILPVCFKCASVLTQEGVVGNLTPTADNPFYDIATCTIHLAGN